ncbi:RrF2 family transcriptional regulator [Gehongia tenuis]|uniref:Rrf2 family transcriptional regulator n=1 Tax=Gehongia tenuis TaxID=2763655 RepID=A0A926HKR5_9FIRM|nr:Rrf2 family transcriptional regulator [Gehongia tenuis]MBC8531272.1 Rrf2 family transcriptional regulator [Gehongia tenuis]
MKMSTKGRYGLRAVIDLALQGGEHYVSLAEIADRQDLSLDYLELVFSALRKGGIVKSAAGLKGGYLLNMEPAQLTLYRLLTVLEGDLSVTGGSCTDTLYQRFLKEQVWDPMDGILQALLQSITIQDMMDDYGRKQKIMGASL